jgi:hypothetical protein
VYDGVRSLEEVTIRIPIAVHQINDLDTLDLIAIPIGRAHI